MNNKKYKKNMKVIDIFNKIAKGKVKDLTRFIITLKDGREINVFYDKTETSFQDCLKNCGDGCCYDDISFNDKIEILEED